MSVHFSVCVCVLVYQMKTPKLLNAEVSKKPLEALSHNGLQGA